MRLVYVWASQVNPEDRWSLWKRAGQSTSLPLDFFKGCCNFRDGAVNRTKFLSPLSSQELSEFSEGPDTIWTVAGGEFDQVRRTSRKGATDLVILCYLLLAHPPLLSSVNRRLWGWMAPDCENEENLGRRPTWLALRFLCRGVPIPGSCG